MRQWWDQLAPHGPTFPVAWLQRLVREFGLQVPMQVLRQFALSDRTLADLDHPERYKSYFLRCCYTQQNALAGKPEDQEAGREGKKEQEDMETAVDDLVADVALLSARFCQEDQSSSSVGVLQEEAVSDDEVLQTVRSAAGSAPAPRSAWGPAPSAPVVPDPELEAHAPTSPEKEAMDGNDHVLGHPALDSIDQRVSRLLPRLDGDRPQVRSTPAEEVQVSRASVGEDAQRTSAPSRPSEQDTPARPADARPSDPGRISAAEQGRRPSSRRTQRREPEETFSVALGHYWPGIAPGCPLPAESSLLALEQDYSRHLVLAVARHLLLTGCKLPELEQPDQAWHAFVRACQQEAQHPSYSDPSPAVAPARPSRSAVAGPGALRADAPAEEKAA